MEFYLFDMESKQWWRKHREGFTSDIKEAFKFDEVKAEYLAILSNKGNVDINTPRTVLIPVEGYPVN